MIHLNNKKEESKELYEISTFLRNQIDKAWESKAINSDFEIYAINSEKFYLSSDIDVLFIIDALNNNDIIEFSDKIQEIISDITNEKSKRQNNKIRFAFVIDTNLNEDPKIIDFILSNDDPASIIDDFFESYEAKNDNIHYSKFSKLIKHGIEEIDWSYNSAKFIFYFSSTHFLDPLELRSCIIELGHKNYCINCYGYNNFSIEAFNKMKDAYKHLVSDYRRFF